MSDYEDMTVAQLKELLKEAGLPVSGKKADLIARLQEGSDEPAPVEESAEEEAEEDDFEEDYEDEDWDDEEFDEEHVARQKPVLSDDMKAALALSGSGTRDYHARDGESHTVWITSRDATSSTEVPLLE